MSDELHLLIRTPHEIVFDETIVSARLPTPTGQVGLRPRAEPLLLAIEPGLVLLRFEGGTHFAATAGGLFESDREKAVLYTPFGVTGDDAERVLDALEQALATPGGDVQLRRRLGELEEHIVREVRSSPLDRRPRRQHG